MTPPRTGHSHNQRHRPFNAILWLNILFAVALIIILVLIPVTGGKSLGAICPWGILLLIHGLCYVMFSNTKPEH